PSGCVGEAWCISGHEAGSTVITGGEYDGMTLRKLYEQQRQLFANDPNVEFPLLVKILDAQQDLSIQIHPDNLYAQKYEKSYGKTECWYVLDSEAQTNLILGHNGDKSAVLKAMETKEWNDILRYHPIQRGDFFFVPAGTIHAICKGSIIYEVQQSSDVTYRMYDYDRLENGKLRELHEQKAIDVLKPFDIMNTRTSKMLFKNDYIEQHQLVDSDYFEVEHYIFKKGQRIAVKNDSYLLCSVFYGTFIINGENFEHGNHFICTSQYSQMNVEGEGELFITRAKI
ncbi:MAG: type I phosphomannose isomerase catalytic subunit, partial [Culicoidibacterales bacterium]